jgi:hypothetical protein
VLLRDFDRTIEGAGAVSGADNEHGRDSGFASSRNDLLTIRVEAGAIEMTVGVDKH